MRILRNVLLLLLGGLAALALFVATRPGDFRIERATTIDAPPETVFPLVNDLHAWSRWSPFERDPDMKKEFAGSGEGATYRWEGNRDVGQGLVTITESVPSERIAIRLDFYEPMRATNDVEFRFTPVGDGTRAVWAMEGRNGFVAKAFALVMDMDGMVGGEFEKGLAAMKAAAESDAQDAG